MIFKVLSVPPVISYHQPFPLNPPPIYFNPSRPNPRRREKIMLNFYFHTSLWCFERSYEGLKGLHKTFWGTTKKCENKNLIWFLFQCNFQKCTEREGLNNSYFVYREPVPVLCAEFRKLKITSSNCQNGLFVKGRQCHIQTCFNTVWVVWVPKNISPQKFFSKIFPMLFCVNTKWNSLQILPKRKSSQGI